MYTPMLRGAFLWPLAWFSFALFLLYSPRQPAKGGDDFVPDWSPDDDEPETPAKPSPVDFTQLAAGADNRSEVLDRVLTLLEQQKLRSQAMVARQEAERTRSNWQEEAFSLICGPEPLRLLDLLDEVTESNVLMMRDGNGLNLLHQCCRIGCIPVVEKLLTIHPALTDQMTSPHGRPAFWSPLMVLLDAKRIMWEDSYKELMGLILASSSLATLEARAANGSSALHMACSRPWPMVVDETDSVRGLPQSWRRPSGLWPGHLYGQPAKWTWGWLCSCCCLMSAFFPIPIR